MPEARPAYNPLRPGKPPLTLCQRVPQATGVARREADSRVARGSPVFEDGCVGGCGQTVPATQSNSVAQGVTHAPLARLDRGNGNRCQARTARFRTHANAVRAGAFACCYRSPGPRCRWRMYRDVSLYPVPRWRVLHAWPSSTLDASHEPRQRASRAFGAPCVKPFSSASRRLLNYGGRSCPSMPSAPRSGARRWQRSSARRFTPASA
jgi:hypothetical protein